MIILIGGEKGGTGKTTLIANLAALRMQAGHDVLLVDTDLQGSASYWAQVRDESGIMPRVACVQKCGKGLQSTIRDLAKRYEDILIDAGGRDSVELRAALVVATKAYIPVQASQFDIWTLDHMDELVATAQDFNPDLRAFVIIARASPHPLVAEATEARTILADYAHLGVAVTVVRDRIAYRRSGREGRAVSELSSLDRKAMAEMSSLYEEVYEEVFDDAAIVSASARDS